VSFSVWKNKDNKLEWTSLMGTDKKKLLRNLPMKFDKCINPSKLQDVRKLWQVCDYLNCIRTHNIIYNELGFYTNTNNNALLALFTPTKQIQIT